MISCFDVSPEVAHVHDWPEDLGEVYDPGLTQLWVHLCDSFRKRKEDFTTHAWRCFTDQALLRRTVWVKNTAHDAVLTAIFDQEIRQFWLNKRDRTFRVDGDLKSKFTSVDLPDDLLEIAMLRAFIGTIL